MNEHPQQTPVNDEVEMVNFFEYLAKFINWLKNAIIAVFKGLFWLLLYKPFVYFKKYKKLIGTFLILSLIGGFIADSLSVKQYYSEILVSPNYDSGKELYTTIDYLNSLIEDGKVRELANTLHIDTAMAKSYLKFEVEPNYNERILLRNFDEYHSIIDTTIFKNIDFETFKKFFKEQKFDYPQHIVSIVATRADAFYPLNDYFKNFLNNNNIFLRRKETALSVLKTNLAITEKAIAQIDSLRSAIDKAISHMGQSDIPGQSVIVGTSQVQFPEKQYDLFQKKEDLMKNLGDIKQSLVEKSQIIILNSLFPKSGSVYNPISHQMKFMFPLGILIIFFIIFLLIDLFYYLDKLYLQSRNNGKTKKNNA